MNSNISAIRKNLAAFTIDAEVPVSFEAPGDIDEILEVSIKYDVPLTWLIYTNRTRPENTLKYYKENVFSRLPETHELGLHVHFDDHILEDYRTDADERREMILAGARLFKKYNISPVSFRAGCWCLQASDIKALEEIGIKIDSSPCPQYRSPNHPGHGDWRKLFIRDPYHPDYNSLLKKGDAKLLILPVCSTMEPGNGEAESGYLEYRGWDGMKPIIDSYIKAGKPMSIGMHDGRANSWKELYDSPGKILEQIVVYLKSQGVEIVTLSKMWESRDRKI